MRKPLRGELWRHRNGRILLIGKSYEFSQDELKAAEVIHKQHSSNWSLFRTVIDNFNDQGQHIGNTRPSPEWDLIELIGNISDPTTTPEDDWSDE